MLTNRGRRYAECVRVCSAALYAARHVVDTDGHGRRTASGGGRAERLADGKQWKWRRHVWPDSKRTATTRVVVAGAFAHSVVANSWPPITGRETRITTTPRSLRYRARRPRAQRQWRPGDC
jgi:hypothetical protein